MLATDEVEVTKDVWTGVGAAVAAGNEDKSDVAAAGCATAGVCKAVSASGTAAGVTADCWLPDAGWLVPDCCEEATWASETCVKPATCCVTTTWCGAVLGPNWL